MKGTLAFSWGKFGGFYVVRKPGSWRVCVAWLALTYVPVELEDLLNAWIREGKAKQIIQQAMQEMRS